MGFDEAVTLKEIDKAARQCKKSVSDKDAPIDWYCHSLTKSKKLRDDILSGRYKVRPGHEVQILRPKYRIATAPYFRDRVWQRSMCNNGIYEDLTRGFIRENIACQKGKGLDMAIRIIIEFLQELHRMDPGATIYVKHWDIKKFFPSTPQREIKKHDAKVITEPRFIPYLTEIIDSGKDSRAKDEIEADPFGKRGTGLGSQINQLHQVALIDPIDHELKNFCKYYIRYNDDFLVLDHDKEIIMRAETVICNRLEEFGLTMTCKGGITTAQKGFEFCRKRFYIKKSGKIIVRLHKKALADERKALRHLKRKLDAGEVDMEHIKCHYQSVIANFEYAGDAPIRAMDKFYTVLFRQHPEYKRSRRYLYGRPHNHFLEGTSTQSGTGERKAQGGAGKDESNSGLQHYDGQH